MYYKPAFFSTILILCCLNMSAKNSKEWEIKAYSSAAPSFIGNDATVIGANGAVLREGTNGWVCLSFSPMPEEGFKSAHEASPACAEESARAWIEAYKNKTVPKISSDGWVWMLQGDLGADNFRAHSESEVYQGGEKGAHWIESGPHLMLMPKDAKSLDGQAADFTAGTPYIMFKGTPYAHLMIPLDGYYDYQPKSAPK